MSQPQLSVIMSVYNGECYVSQAIQSVLSQSFRNFEFIVINDGSTDKTPEILSTFTDNRIRIVHQTNVGLTNSLNRGLRLAHGQYIARQDADDVSHLQRFEKQVEFLETHPEIVLVGCWVKLIDDEGDVIGEKRFMITPEEINKIHPWDNQFVHGSIMVRRKAVEMIGGYREAFRYSQDCDLTLRLSERFSLANLGETLYSHRLTKNMISLANNCEQQKYGWLAQQFYQQRLGGQPDPLELNIPIQQLLETVPDTLETDQLLYYRRIIAYYLRQGRLRKSRKAVLILLKNNFFQPRIYIYWILTFCGHWFTPRLMKLWDRFSNHIR